MKFKIENLGLINTANIDLKKINVITGKNSVIKSNLSGILYCFLAPASKDYEMITEYKIYMEILHYLVRYDVSQNKKLDDCHEFLYDDKNKECLELFRQIIINEEFYDKTNLLNELDRIEKLFDETKEEQYYGNLDFLLKSEFCYIGVLLQDSKITFYNNNEKIVLEEDGEIINDLHNLNLENVIYMTIDKKIDPYHNTQVRHKLRRFDSTDDEDIIKMANKIDETINNCNVCEPPAGLMLLDQLRRLLLDNQLSKNSYLILDNPENDLHPLLQVKLAEILVLFALKLNITLYINTNSPFLTEALEAYCKFYNIYSETNFYHIEKDDIDDTYYLRLLDDLSISEVYSEYEDAFEIIKNIHKKINLGVNEGYF